MKGELRVLPQRGDGPDLQTEVDTLALQLASATQQLQIMAQERFNLVRALNVIIMAAGYSDEVAGILRRDFDNTLNVSILRDYGLEAICMDAMPRTENKRCRLIRPS